MKTGEIPTFYFILKRYGKNFCFTDRIVKKELIGRILPRWKFAKDKKGIPEHNILKKQTGFDFIEIHARNGEELLRFPYFLDSVNKRIIILTGYSKPWNYDDGDKDSRRVDRDKEEAQKYYDDYKENRNKALIIPKSYSNIIG
ncbi:MAG: hypothetical protein PF572_04415 [Patescibacteria group bacterium]|jgi:hypothetical protein|nr:hypothetical protein [Patescibacteria group bacterium]